MTTPRHPSTRGGTGSRAGRPPSRRQAALAAILALQALCAVFFAGDVASDLRQEGPSFHLAFEALVVVALGIGLAFGAVEMRRTLDRARRAERTAEAARGAFADYMTECFDAWGLTPAEADVALLTLKGVGTADIATARGAAAGTVRAQLARVYAKAGVSGRGEFVSLFVEALVDGSLADNVETSAAPSRDAS